MEDTTASPEGATTQGAAAQVEPQNPLEKVLAFVPRALSSHAHIIFLAGLGVYLVLLPLFGVSVSSKSELIGGNYTNVTSDLGACIAAGLTVHLAKRDRHRQQELRDVLGALHRRHDELQSAIGDVTAAAQRAESAAANAGRRLD